MMRAENLRNIYTCCLRSMHASASESLAS
jgi:hypothetical protein